jgi:predicted house-cleaning noncanonical NTP pyrophosphatase (MazG superfamily)
MIAFSEQLIDIAGGLDQITEAAQSYVDKFYTDAEKFASTKQSIRDVAGILPRTREDYRRLVESIDLTSEVGKQAYYTLMALSDTADSYYSHIEDIANQRAEMEIELLNAQGKTAEALAASRKRELEAMDESLRPLQELIWLTQDLGTQLETVTTSVTTEINALISTSSSAASQARSMANTYKNLIETLEEAQVKIFGGGKAGAQIRLNDIYGKAMTGDADAIGKMPAAIDTLLNESLASAHTLLEYRRDQAKSYIALKNAQKVSTSMMNWEEYQATLLETQTKVLELIRDDIQSNNYAELQKHSELLGNIGTLLETSNAVTLTGNATQDVIKNLDAINTSYTAEMLTELVSGGTSQTNSLLSILSSSQTVVTLLGQLLSVFQANEQAIAQKEIEMASAEYLASISDKTAALDAYNAARAATAAASEKANIEASQYLQANQVAAWASQVYVQDPTAYNKSVMDKYLSIANTEYSQYAAAQANLNTATAQEKAALNIYNETLSTAAQLKAVTNALIDIYNAQYPSTPIPKFAEGGFVMVGEQGPELAQFGSSARIYSNKDSKALMDNSGTVAELKSLRQDVQVLTSVLKTQTKKTADILDKFDRQGLPAERAA